MHFYAKDENGKIEPRHFVTMAKDKTKTRPSRTTDAYKAKKDKGETWYSSVTTVLNILDKPALLNWKVDKHLEQAFFTDEIDHFDDWVRVVKAKTREEMDKAPQAGTDIHQVLEDNLWVYGNSLLTIEEDKIVTNVESVLKGYGITEGCEHIKEGYFVEEEYGYAGCADLIIKGEELWVIDYKSKQTADKFKVGKMAYPEHSRQLAAYGRAFFGDKVFRAANIFVCLETGEVDFHEHTQSSLMSGWLDFKDCLSIYQRNNYNPKDVK